MALGFAGGVPFSITRDFLKAWMTEANVDLGTIGLFSGLTLPFTIKFLWAPGLDRYVPYGLGRRRGWLIISQICLAVAILFLGQIDPRQSLLWIAIMALTVSFFSATQDIAIDAHRREFLTNEELGFGSALYMNMYRVGQLSSLAVGIFVAQHFGYAYAHVAMAMMLVVGAIATLLSKEPQMTEQAPATLVSAAVEPLREFFRRKGAWLILAFFLFYKIGDNMAGAMTVPFILKLGFDKTDYLYIVKGVGMFALFGGMLLGGALMVRLGLFWSLISFGVLQMVSTAGFAWLALVGKSFPVLTSVVVFELMSTGLGTAAYATFMAMQTDRRFTATQYALFTSLMALPGTLAAMATGFMAEAFGWPGFYLTCALVAIPGLLLIPKICSPETEKA